MKQRVIKDAYKEIIKEVQTIITISYVLAVCIGILFTFQKYSDFVLE